MDNIAIWIIVMVVLTLLGAGAGYIMALRTSSLNDS